MKNLFMNRKGMGSLGMIGLVAIGMVAAFGVTQTDYLSQTSGPDAASADDDSVASLYLKAEDTTADTADTFVNVSYEIDDQNGQQIASGTTDTSSGYAQISDLDENTKYTVRMYDDDGAGDDFYYNEETVSTNEGVVRDIIEVQKEGSATTDVFETSGASDDDDKLKISQGATETFDVEVKENTQNAAFRQPALVVKTNDTAAVSNLEVSGSSAEGVPTRLSSYDDLFDTGTAEIIDFNKEQYTVQVTRGESNSDDATVDVAVVDQARFKNDDGDWVEGYEDQDDNNVGASDATIATQTIIN